VGPNGYVYVGSGGISNNIFVWSYTINDGVFECCFRAGLNGQGGQIHSLAIGLNGVVFSGSNDKTITVSCLSDQLAACAHSDHLAFITIPSRAAVSLGAVSTFLSQS
jgi:hypothetical protein